MPNEFGLQGPLADGWLAPTGEGLFASAEADAWRVSAWGGRFPIGVKACADQEGVLCVGGGRCLARGAPNEFGLGGPSADGRPAPTGKASLASAEADAWRVSAWGGRFPIGVKAFGRRSACAPNEFGLKRPPADGRPAPTGKALFASAEADAWRVSA